MTPQPAKSENRRASVRIACRIPGVLSCDTGLELTCQTLDLSLGGLRVQLPNRLRDTSGHTIEAITLRGVPRLSVQLRWARDHEAGLAFTGNKSEAALVRALLVHLAKARAEAQKARLRPVQNPS